MRRYGFGSNAGVDGCDEEHLLPTTFTPIMEARAAAAQEEEDDADEEEEEDDSDDEEEVAMALCEPPRMSWESSGSIGCLMRSE